MSPRIQAAPGPASAASLLLRPAHPGSVFLFVRTTFLHFPSSF
ncbi:hypothetical protein ARZXY2_3271 [Arthrobacter sp. ZXY-2]|nr:hypothetical protein ARZXY2_3271 [Arthrobacter sp. ZXY-2]